MREVSLKNQRIKKILSGITEAAFEEETLKKICKDAREYKDPRIEGLHGVSEEYFKTALKLNVRDYAYPQCQLGAGTNLIEPQASPVLHEVAKKKIIKIHRTLGAKDTALCMMYPEKGYIGWHHNGNAPGYNLLFSYSMDGDGWFKYYDREKDEIVKMQDSPGWNVKCGYYPSEKTETDRVYWHAAYTEKPRLSIAFIIPQRDLWLSMIEYITDGDYDRDHLQSQGPLKDLKDNGYI